MTVSWLHRAGTLSLRGLVAFGKFWYGFIIGDDWTVAAAVAGALGGTWVLAPAGVAGRVGCPRWLGWPRPAPASAASAVDGHTLPRAGRLDRPADHPDRTT